MEINLYLNNVNSFSDFYQKMVEIDDNNQKGRIFEQFACLYFTYFNRFDEYCMYKDVSLEFKKCLKLPFRDKGIDAIGRKDDKYFAIQVKFIKDKTLYVNKLSTFYALNYSRPLYPIIFTSAKNIDKGLIYIERVDYTILSQKCNAQFWDKIREISREKITPKKITIIPRSPFKFQQQILDYMYQYFDNNNKGKLICACGSGKTLISFWFFAHYKFNKVCIFIYGQSLLSQFYNEWETELIANNLDYELLPVCSDFPNRLKNTTDKSKIKSFMQNNRLIVFSTYDSSHLLVDEKFDLIIYDEAHHTTGNENKSYCDSMEVEATKKLFMTATEVNFKNSIYSMDNKLQYGKLIYRYTIKQAIIDDNLCDYRIICIYVNKVEDRDYLTAYLIKECFEMLNINHMIVYCENIKHSYKLKNITDIDATKFVINSNTYVRERNEHMDKFRESEKAILYNCHILGEGIDLPICDSVCFARNMSSEVEIIQSIGRCLRKYKDKKIGYIIIPYIVDKDVFEEDNSFEKLRHMLKAIYNEDDTIKQKLVFKDFKELSSTKKLDFKETQNDEYEIDFDILKDLLLKEFDKDGSEIDPNRKKIIDENKNRYIKGQMLIDTKEKAEDFLKFKLENKNENWVKWCLGTLLYDKIKQKYYLTLDEFIRACEKLNISDITTYKQKYFNDKKLIPFEYYENNYYDNNNTFFNFLFKHNNDNMI
ncbi:MAG: DEAD/DEAH box helicase family protein [Candidatus Micrarchaeaceae archaeon]